MTKKQAKICCEEQQVYTERSGARFDPQAVQGVMFRYNERGQPVACLMWKRDQHNKVLLNSTMTSMYMVHDGLTYALSLGRMMTVMDDVSVHMLRDVEIGAADGAKKSS